MASSGLATPGPIVSYGGRPAPGNLTSNPNAGPSMVYAGVGILDARYGYDATGLGCVGWYGLGPTPVVDQVPSTISATNIAAAQVPVAATPLTLVSSSGAGITVLAASLFVYPYSAASGINIPSGTLEIDGAPGVVGIGRAVVATGNSRFQWYDPTKSVSRCLRYTSVGDDHLATVTTVGFDLYGYPQTETVTLTNAGIATGLKAFKFITSITPAGTLSGSNLSVGTSDCYGLPLATGSAGYVDVYWGTPASELAPGGTVAGRTTIILPLQLADLAAGTFKVGVPFDGTINSALWRTAKPASTSTKAATLTVEINGTLVTGGVMALTTANQNTIGGSVAASSITALNSFTAGQTIGVTVTSVTAFVEGDGWLEMTVENTDIGGGTLVAADTTSPATALTGDPRGTILLPSASDGTKRLQIFVIPALAGVSNSGGSNVGLFGVTPV